MQPWAKSFYKSKQWQRVRDAAWKRDAGLCVDCFRAGKITPAEEVHHIIELTPLNIRQPSIALGMDNLVSLCRECHKKRHGAHGGRRYVIDATGHVELRDL